MITTGMIRPCLVLRARVELLAELHDVDAVLAERGADRRRRVRRAGGALQLDDGDDLLRHLSAPWRVRAAGAVPASPSKAVRPSPPSCSRAHRGGPTEDLHHHPDLLLVRHHLVDEAREVRERPAHDADVLALLEADLRLRLDRAFLDLLRHARDFVVVDRRRAVAAADEAGDLRRVLHDVPGLVGQLHVDEDVAGEELAARRALLALHHLDHVLLGNQDLVEQLLLAERARALEQGLLRLGLVTRSRCGRCTTSWSSGFRYGRIALHRRSRARRPGHAEHRRPGSRRSRCTPIVPPTYSRCVGQVSFRNSVAHVEQVLARVADPDRRGSTANSSPVSSALGAGRRGGTRTPNLRIWSPMLYQLCYAPSRARSNRSATG